MRYQDKKAIIVGGSGFIGTQLALRLLSEGAHITIIDPYPSSLTEVVWLKNDLSDSFDPTILQGNFVIFNLAGAQIFARWNTAYKQKIKSSRINVTKNLVDSFNSQSNNPEFFISTSAIGVYGDRGSEMLDENSKTIQNTFLAEVAFEWEQEALRAKEFGVQTRIIRNAHVLGKGGILGVLKKIFNLYIGGRLSTGKQYMSFVSVERCVDAYVDAPFSDVEIKNAVSIEPVTNSDFSKKLGKILSRPSFFMIPVFGIKMLYGDFAREIVSSQRVYTVNHPSLENLDVVLKKNI